MKIIDSTTNKDAKMRIITYSFNINNERFTANYFYGKKPKFEFFHNDSLIGSGEQIKNKSEFIVNTENEQLTITVWLEYSVYSMYLGKLNGIGIEVNKNPVQHTLADPEVYVNNGRSGLFILLFILGLESIITIVYYQSFIILGEILSNLFAPNLTWLFSNVIIVIPPLIVLFLLFIYKRWTKFALISGIIIWFLEFVTYGMGLYDSFKSGSQSNAAMILFWLILRVCIFFILYNAFKYKRKQEINSAT